MSKVWLITGCSTGFGRELAKYVLESGNKAAVTARKPEDVQDIVDGNRENAIALKLDITKEDEIKIAVAETLAKFGRIDVLVNNAGLALGRDNFADADIEDWETMIDTNVKGLLYVSKAIVPYMIQQGKGHIINIGSTAGKEVYLNGNIYCASKFAVDAISKAQRIDLLQHRIKVTAVNPGAAETEFSLVRFKGDENKAGASYEGFKPLQAADIANAVYYCATLPEHVCINDLVITCTAQANSYYLDK